MSTDTRRRTGNCLIAWRAGGAHPIERAAGSDRDLLRRVVARDRSAMRILYSRHCVRVFRFALRLVHNEATAEDIVSEVFLDVWRLAGRFEERSQVSTWLLAIARNKACSLMKRRAAYALDDDAAASIQDTADDPETALQRRETGELMRKCLEQLSPAHREIIDLVYYHGKKVGEVAGIVGIAENTVKTRMFYARRQLAGLLNAHGVSAVAA